MNDVKCSGEGDQEEIETVEGKGSASDEDSEPDEEGKVNSSASESGDEDEGGDGVDLAQSRN